MSRAESAIGAPVGANIVVLRGVLSRPVEERLLASGSRFAAFDVTVAATEDRRSESVQVVWFDPPTSATEHVEGSEVVVVGRVRRRFFRAGSQTQSRTEVVAETIVSTRSAKRAGEAVRRAASLLAQLE